MVFNLKSLPLVLGAAALAAGLTVGGALADEQSETADETNATMNDEATAQEQRAEQSNSCEEYGRESAGWTLNVAYDNDPRHTPCVSDTGSRIRSNSDD